VAWRNRWDRVGDLVRDHHLHGLAGASNVRRCELRDDYTSGDAGSPFSEEAEIGVSGAPMRQRRDECRRKDTRQ
jgi:hypothetical protein